MEVRFYENSRCKVTKGFIGDTEACIRDKIGKGNVNYLLTKDRAFYARPFAYNHLGDENVSA